MWQRGRTAARVTAGRMFPGDRTEIGHKAAVHAGKVLAAAAIDLFNQPEILKEAREEFEKRTAAGFVSPVPADAVPTIPD